jgi:hypothetical protein
MLQSFTALGIALAGCRGVVPQANTDVSSGQMVMDLGTSVMQLREDNALLQAQIDSLRGAVAYQDTILRQLATQANVPMRVPGPTVP